MTKLLSLHVLLEARKSVKTPADHGNYVLKDIWKMSRRVRISWVWKRPHLEFRFPELRRLQLAPQARHLTVDLRNWTQSQFDQSIGVESRNTLALDRRYSPLVLEVSQKLRAMICAPSFMHLVDWHGVWRNILVRYFTRNRNLFG